jgi:Ser/Thr protein kinase RdoA (MazF antagonist)
VQALLARFAPGETALDLGGMMSLNVHILPSDRVIRVHRRFVSRARITAERSLRREWFDRGLNVPEPGALDGREFRQWHGRLVEAERYLPSQQPDPTIANYHWLFAELGYLHTVTAATTVELPRQLAASWSPPSSLRRWLAHMLPALAAHPDYADVLQNIARGIERRWIAPAAVPAQVIHGDFRLGNICLASDGRTVVYDLGFAERAPRVRDVAYSLAYAMLALPPDTPTEETVHDLIGAYNETAPGPVTILERAAIPPYAASVLIHAAAHAGYMADPACAIEHHVPFVRLASAFVAMNLPS